MDCIPAPRAMTTQQVAIIRDFLISLFSSGSGFRFHDERGFAFQFPRLHPLALDGSLDNNFE
jgi:hypothetical protein